MTFTRELQGESIDDKVVESLGGGGGNRGGGVVVRVFVDGDREDTEQGPNPDEGKNLTVQEEKEKSGPKAGKSKRKRPANRCAHMQHIVGTRIVHRGVFFVCVCCSTIVCSSIMSTIGGSSRKESVNVGTSRLLIPPTAT